MATYVSHFIGDEHLVLGADRTLYWENERTLVVADVHIGKTGHFRKEGIGVPQQVYKDDLHCLLSQILFFKAEKLIIVGDLSHSAANKELELFKKWRRDFSSLEVELVRGNHDILHESWYRDASITVRHGAIQYGPFTFVHDIADMASPERERYTFSGHLHPGVSISGRGRQSLHFPCFYFTPSYCVLPAFSRFTGTYKVRPQKGEKIFALMNRQIMPLF